MAVLDSRYSLPRALACLAFIVTLASCVTHDRAAKKSPNVVFVLVDDLGFSQTGLTKNISSADFDPQFVDYSTRNLDYSQAEAVDLARRSTPELDRLAAQGIAFTNAYTASNLCAPSRMAIATGKNLAERGIYFNVDAVELGPQPGTVLASRLADSGYSTAHIGKWHLGKYDERMADAAFERNGIKPGNGKTQSVKDHPGIEAELRAEGYYGSSTESAHPLNHGFRYYYGYNHYESPFYNADNLWENRTHADPGKTYNTDLFTDKAIQFIDKSLEDGKPFFVQLHYHAVHKPLNPAPPAKYLAPFNSSSEVLKNFYGHVYAVDQNIARLRAHLKAQGVADDTIIIFASDNGGAVGGLSPLPGNAPYQGHKGTQFLGGLRTQFLFHWPNGIVAPRLSDLLVSTIDIMPTVLALAGIDPGGDLDGKSLAATLTSKADTQVRNHLVWTGVHARTWGFSSQYDFLPEVQSRENAPFAWVVVKDNYVARLIDQTKPGLYRDIPAGAPSQHGLYNLATDPGERENLVSTKPEVYQTMRQLWLQDADDHLPPAKVDPANWRSLRGER